MVGFAPAIDYDFYIAIFKDRRMTLECIHDGFYRYEVYTRVNSGNWQTLYTFQEQTINSLAPAEIRTNISKNLI